MWPDLDSSGHFTFESVLLYLNEAAVAEIEAVQIFEIGEGSPWDFGEKRIALERGK